MLINTDEKFEHRVETLKHQAEVNLSRVDAKLKIEKAGQEAQQPGAAPVNLLQRYQSRSAEHPSLLKGCIAPF